MSRFFVGFMRRDRDIYQGDFSASDEEARMILHRWQEEFAKNVPPNAPPNPGDTLVVQFGKDEIILSSRLAVGAEGPAAEYQFPTQRGPRERKFKTPDGKKVVAKDADYFFSSEKRP